MYDGSVLMILTKEAEHVLRQCVMTIIVSMILYITHTKVLQNVTACFVG